MHDKGTTVPRVCETCSKPFSARSRTIKLGMGRFCSKQCHRWPLPVPEYRDDGSAAIPLFARDRSVRAYVIVDAADAVWAAQWRWKWRSGYANRVEKVDGRSRNIQLHRELLGLTHEDTLTGDHIDHDTLNCRRSNLRAVTQAQNRQNTSGKKRSTSVYRGVSWCTTYGKWVAQATVGGKTHKLGRFDSEQEAAEVARAGRLRLLPFAVD